MSAILTVYIGLVLEEALDGLLLVLVDDFQHGHLLALSLVLSQLNSTTIIA